MGLERINVLQFHVWEDAWADDERWQRAVNDLKSEGVIKGVGISINRWKPNNALNTLRTGQIDAVQVICNIFDQAPENKLVPLCRELKVAVNRACAVQRRLADGYAYQKHNVARR